MDKCLENTEKNKETVVHIAVPVDNYVFFFFCADIYTYADRWGRVVGQVGNR